MSEALENGRPLSRRQQAPRLPEMDWTLLIAAAALLSPGATARTLGPRP